LAEIYEQIKNNTLDSGCKEQYARPLGEARDEAQARCCRVVIWPDRDSDRAGTRALWLHQCRKLEGRRFHELANAGDFSAKLAPKLAAAPSLAAGGSMKPDSPQNLSSEMQIEAIELASNFILKTTLHNRGS
jgi:hypothetical protein